MASTTDIWAVTPVYSATLLRLAAVIGAGGDVPLLTNQPLIVQKPSHVTFLHERFRSVQSYFQLADVYTMQLVFSLHQFPPYMPDSCHRPGNSSQVNNKDVVSLC